MRVIPSALAVLLLISFNTAAETITQSLPACVSEELLDQMTRAIMNKDEQAYNYLLKHGCFALKTGTPISVLTKGTDLHIRAYSGDDAVELWTFVESIEPKESDNR